VEIWWGFAGKKTNLKNKKRKTKKESLCRLLRRKKSSIVRDTDKVELSPKIGLIYIIHKGSARKRGKARFEISVLVISIQ